jgi:hypothetical protein
MKTPCGYCAGKGSFSVYAVQETHGDFVGDRIRTRREYVADRTCRHCKGSKTCDCKKCSTILNV